MPRTAPKRTRRSPVPRKPPPSPIPAALHAIRLALGLSVYDFALRLRVTTRTLGRWEHGQTKLLPRSHEAVLAAVGDAPEAELQALRVAMGFPAPPPPRPSPALAGEALYAVAEEHDVSPKRLRAQLVSFLSRAEALGLTVTEAREHLLATEPRRPKRERSSS